MIHRDIGGMGYNDWREVLLKKLWKEGKAMTR